MKYVSIDIETTGTDPKQHEVVEFAAIIDNLDGSLLRREQLPSFRVLFIKDNWNVNPYCALLHRDLWEEMKVRKSERSFCLSSAPNCYGGVGGLSTQAQDDAIREQYLAILKQKHINVVMHKHTHLRDSFSNWLRENGYNCQNDMRVKINVAGKNFANFDKAFLEQPAISLQETIDIRHRVIDVATHFWQYGDECLPDTLTCLKRAGLNPNMKLTHTAEEDAWNVIQLVRESIGLKRNF